MIVRGERNGGEEGTKIEMGVDVYLNPTKSDLSRFHSFILSKSKVVMSRTQDLHIPWGEEGRKGGGCVRGKRAKERREERSNM